MYKGERNAVCTIYVGLTQMRLYNALMGETKRTSVPAKVYFIYVPLEVCYMFLLELFGYSTIKKKYIKHYLFETKLRDVK